MPEDTAVKIRVKSGESEAEIEAPLSDIRQAIELIPEVLAKLPQASLQRASPTMVSHVQSGARHSEAPPSVMQIPTTPSSAPSVAIEKGDSLSDVISKFFADSWGRSPRKLMEVREVLQSYGLNYPKQSVAVALLRLAKGSKIRRFKGDGGEYVYTASTGAIHVSPSTQTNGVRPPTQDAAPVADATAEGDAVEEQLNLDVPSPN